MAVDALRKVTVGTKRFAVGYESMAIPSPPCARPARLHSRTLSAQTPPSPTLDECVSRALFSVPLIAPHHFLTHPLLHLLRLIDMLS